ncbi:hypothetical protein MOO45_07280 [Bombilactobacillus folatiphilus]|uniref:Uncharacterized protein n=1 Tax=Bombilactobacillus folatiphilus TaxID=2923362 RepID=A0ABY4P8K7_9LACO|nr:hypothetical protein [Bombilactobacillus folatiphilus]UQS81983.1 hypothetical protein MOO45_07280 [Bombilactobacillus folatiphilus]
MTNTGLALMAASTTINGKKYYLTNELEVTKGSTTTANLVLVDQLQHLQFTKLPDINFGKQSLLFKPNVTYKNQTGANQLTIQDTRNPNVGYPPYEVTLSLAPFRHSQVQKGLANAQLSFQLRGNTTSAINLSPDGEKVTLFQQSQVNSASKTFDFDDGAGNLTHRLN